METLEIIRKVVRKKVTTFGVDNKGYPTYRGSRIYQSDLDPEGIEIPEDTVSFTVEDNETIETVDGSVYIGNNNALSVYIGMAIPIEDALKKYPDNILLRYGCKVGAKRVAIRADGHVNPMYDNAITYDEYCEQYRKLHEQSAIKEKSSQKNN